MRAINFLRLWEVYFPDCTLRDFVGQRCPSELLPISAISRKKIEDRAASMMANGVQQSRNAV